MLNARLLRALVLVFPGYTLCVMSAPLPECLPPKPGLRVLVLVLDRPANIERF